MRAPDFASSPFPARLTPLIGLQFFALAWVVLNQFRLHLGLEAGARCGLVFKGYLGAELFFVLAGFAAANAYEHARSAPAPSRPARLWSRLAKVYPLHLAMIVLLAALMAAASLADVAFDRGVGDLHGLFSNLLMIQAWGTEPTVSWNFPSWLISAAWFADLVFPVTAFIALRFWRGPVMAVVAPVALFTLAYQFADSRGVLFSDMTAQIGALQTVPAYLFGAGLYRLGRDRDLPAGWGGVMAVVAGAWIVVASLLRLSDIALFPAFGALVYGLAETAKGERPALSGPIMQRLGQISMAMFLVYLPVDILYFHAMARLAPHPVGALAWTIWSGVFPVILLAGFAAHRLIQAPAQAWLRGHNPFAQARTAAAAA